MPLYHFTSSKITQVTRTCPKPDSTRGLKFHGHILTLRINNLARTFKNLIRTAY